MKVCSLVSWTVIFLYFSFVAKGSFLCNHFFDKWLQPASLHTTIITVLYLAFSAEHHSVGRSGTVCFFRRQHRGNCFWHIFCEIMVALVPNHSDLIIIQLLWLWMKLVFSKTIFQGNCESVKLTIYLILYYSRVPKVECLFGRNCTQHECYFA